MKHIIKKIDLYNAKLDKIKSDISYFECRKDNLLKNAKNLRKELEKLNKIKERGYL